MRYLLELYNIAQFSLFNSGSVVRKTREVLLCVGLVFPAERLVILLYIVQISVDIRLFVSLDDTACDVGAVVGYSLKVREDILKDVSKLNGTLVILETADVAVFKLCAESVDYFFKGFYLVSLGEVVQNVSFKRFIYVFRDSVRYDFKLVEAFMRFSYIS